MAERQTDFTEHFNAGVVRAAMRQTRRHAFDDASIFASNNSTDAAHSPVKSDRKMSDRKMSDRKMSDRKIGDRKMSDRKMSDRKIGDRKPSPIFLSDIFLSDYFHQ